MDSKELITIVTNRAPVVVQVNTRSRFIRRGRIKMASKVFTERIAEIATGGTTITKMFASILRANAWVQVANDDPDENWITIGDLRFKLVPSMVPLTKIGTYIFHGTQRRFYVNDGLAAPKHYIAPDDVATATLDPAAEAIRSNVALRFSSGFATANGDHIFYWSFDAFSSYSRPGLDELNHDGWLEAIFGPIRELWTEEIEEMGNDYKRPHR